MLDRKLTRHFLEFFFNLFALFSYCRFFFFPLITLFANEYRHMAKLG